MGKEKAMKQLNLWWNIKSDQMPICFAIQACNEKAMLNHEIKEGNNIQIKFISIFVVFIKNKRKMTLAHFNSF